ncbi:MAG: ABC transporter permease [Longimicrobiales bacterium]
MIFPRLVRIAIALTFPRDFRSDFGEDVFDVAVRGVEERIRGGQPVGMYRLRILTDVVRSGLAERFRPGGLPVRRDAAAGRPSSLLFQDLRYGARGLRRAPGFATLAILTLALGIGGTTAMFTVLNSVLLRPLDFPDPDRIVRLQLGRPVTPRQLDGLAERTLSYRAIAGGARTTFTLTGEGRPEELPGSVVGHDHDAVFGVAPVLGRAFIDEDAAPGATPVAILSHELWQSRFGGERSILGRSVALGGEQEGQRLIVGVWPRGYTPFAWSSDVFVPLVREPDSHLYLDMARFQIAARLLDSSTYGSALDELRSTLGRMAAGAEGAFFSDDVAASALLVSYQEAETGSAKGALWLLLGAVGIVLLIACTNVTNLVLARTASRSQEFAIRAAIGAGRGRVLRQLLTEGVLLAGLGGVVGWIGGVLALPLLMRVMPSTIPRPQDVSGDVSVWVFATVVSLGAGLAVGLLPGLRSGRGMGVALRSGSRRSSGGPARFRLNRVLVAGQIGLCVVLVMASGLLLKSLWLVGRVDPGFNANELYTFKARLPSEAYPDLATKRVYFDEVLTRLGGVPGVEAAGGIQVLPLSRGNLGVGISPDGAPVPDNARPMFVGYRMITPGYGQAMQIPLREGRWLDRSDNTDAAPVGLINERMAERLFPNQSAVGRSVHWNTGDPWFTVIGVTGNVHQNRLDEEPRMEAYVPVAQDGDTEELHFMVRSASGPALLASLRDAAWSVDSQVPITLESEMVDVVASSVADRRGHAVLFTVFGALALLLGGIGVYGVTAYTVSQRTHEMGVRLALGADRGAVVMSTLRSSLAPVATGLVAGLAAALAVTRLLAGTLYQVTTNDPTVLFAVALTLLLVALLAALVPARRASRSDPMTTLSRA